VKHEKVNAEVPPGVLLRKVDLRASNPSVVSLPSRICRQISSRAIVGAPIHYVYNVWVAESTWFGVVSERISQYSKVVVHAQGSALKVIFAPDVTGRYGHEDQMSYESKATCADAGDVDLGSKESSCIRAKAVPDRRNCLKSHWDRANFNSAVAKAIQSSDVLVHAVKKR